MLSSNDVGGINNFKELLKKFKHDLQLDSSVHTLKIYCLNSELSKEEFSEFLKSAYPTSNFNDDFSHTKISSGPEMDEINFYCYKDPNSPILFVLSVFGKGKLDMVVDSLIRSLPKTYYFWLPVSIFDTVKEEIIDHFSDKEIIIDYFSAVRSSHFKGDCVFRPSTNRRIEYSGEDGLETLREMRTNYGVFPKKISFQIDKKLKFSMDQRNTFIINYGLPFLDSILDVIHISLSKFAEINRVLSEVRFDNLEGNGGMDFDINPLSLRFGYAKSFNDMENFLDNIEKNEEGKYCVLNPLLVSGSLFFSATILDVSKKAIFSISGNEEVINILPHMNCGKEVISRFYEEIDLNLDNSTLITPNQNVSRKIQF